MYTLPANKVFIRGFAAANGLGLGDQAWVHTLHGFGADKKQPAPMFKNGMVAARFENPTRCSIVKNGAFKKCSTH